MSMAHLEGESDAIDEFLKDRNVMLNRRVFC